MKDDDVVEPAVDIVDIGIAAEARSGTVNFDTAGLSYEGDVEALLFVKALGIAVIAAENPRAFQVKAWD